MQHLIVDTNQALKIKPEFKFTGTSQVSKRVVVAPYVLAEILLRANPMPTLQNLHNFYLVYGLEPMDALRKIAGLTESEIPRFRPFAYPGIPGPYQNFYSVLNQPLERHQKWATRLKAGHSSLCIDMFKKAVTVRAQLRNKGASGKYSTVDEALSSLPSIKLLVINLITHGGGQTPLVTDSDTLYQAVMTNPYLSGLFKSLLTYIISWSRMWSDERLNFDPAENRDDWVDLTLALYAVPGDAIVTADAKLKRAIDFIYNGRIEAKRAEELR